VLLGIKVQHFPPSITQIPPSSARIVSSTILFSQVIQLVASLTSYCLKSIPGVVD
jgi:hypothetical protein